MGYYEIGKDIYKGIKNKINIETRDKIIKYIKENQNDLTRESIIKNIGIDVKEVISVLEDLESRDIIQDLSEGVDSAKRFQWIRVLDEELL